MIRFLLAILGVAGLIIALLQIVFPALPVEVVNAIAYFFAMLMSFNNILPIHETLTIFLWVIYFEFAIFLVRLALWGFGFYFSRGQQIDQAINKYK